MPFYSRKSPRIPNYDYSAENYYFITICTHNRNCLFGLPQAQTRLGNIAQKHINAIEFHYSCVRIDKFVVMPNHIHMILVIEKGQQADVRQIAGQYKSGVTRDARRLYPGIVLWQRSFHDHIIRKQSVYEEIWAYIDNNPQKWEEDCFYIGKE